MGEKDKQPCVNMLWTLLIKRENRGRQKDTQWRMKIKKEETQLVSVTTPPSTLVVSHLGHTQLQEDTQLDKGIGIAHWHPWYHYQQHG